MRRALVIVAFALALLAAPAVASAAGEGAISGTVTPIAIAPEVEVCLVEARPSEICTAPEANGSYTLGGLPTGIPLRIEFIPSYRSRYAIQYYSGARTAAEASLISLAPLPAVREGVDASLEVGGAIEGVVTAPGGTPLRGVEVCAVEGGRGVSVGCAETDAAGAYALGGLSPGVYKVGFWGRGASAEYAPRYYGGGTTLPQATPVSVPVGTTVAGIDETLTKGATVTGTVAAAATGAALEGEPVCVFAITAVTPTQCTYSGLGGAYRLIGLPAGSYQVGFSLGSAEIGGEAVSGEDDGYLTQYYRGVGNRSEAVILGLTGEEVASGIDGTLVAPSAPPPASQPAPPAGNTVAAPTPVLEPTKKPAAPKCRKGFVKKKVKGATKCVKKAKKTKKHRKKPRRRAKHGKRQTRRGRR